MTGLGLHNGFRGNKWFKHRISVFKNYTLKGLLNQTNRQFVIWISFRQEEKNNPITEKFAEYMLQIDQPCIFTFGGLCFYDDKYNDKERLLKRLKDTLPELREIVKDYKWVYQTIQPSDDIYHQHAIDEIQRQKPAFKKAFGFNKGFILNARTHQLAEWNGRTLPPFSTIVFPTETFLNPEKHYDYIGPYVSHESVPDFFDFDILPMRGFFYVVEHGQNISTVWNHPYKGREIIGEEKRQLFEEFGIADSKIIKTKMPMRLILRAIFNRLRELYHWFKRNVF